MTSLGQRLAGLRQRSFAGRHAEVELFHAALTGGTGVLFVHGPGGVGKTSLLDAFARVAAGRGREPLRIDARHLALGSEALPLPSGERPVLLIDTYELLEPLDDWVREEYLPSLPGDAVVVLAGRRAPGPRWRADPAWRDLMRVVALGNLPSVDARAYLAACDVAEPLREDLLRISRGHPLTLSMLVDAVRNGAAPRALGDLPDVVRALLARTVDETPGPRHRAALEVCAHLPVTTEDSLRAMLGGDVGEVFAWLRGLSFVVESPYGVYPHDVAREALDADLRWRDPERYAAMHRRKLDASQARFQATAGEHERLQQVVDTIVLAGSRSPLAALRGLPPTMRSYLDGLRDGDREPIAGMTARWQGEEQALLVERWLGRRPEAFRVFRTASGELRGFATGLDLTEADVGVDPVVDAMWGYAARHGPPRPGEHVRAWRFFLDRDLGQRPSPSLTLFLACQMLDIFQLRDDAAWSLVSAYEDGDLWGAAMELLDFWPAAEATAVVGGRRFPVYAHDWRRAGRDEWVEVLHARQMGLPVRSAGEGIGHPALPRPEFDDAVRAALRHLGTPELLLDNPLLRSRAVLRHRRSGTTPAEALRELVERATRTMPPDRGELVTRTFLRPGTPQERVAESLHLSFNTYRRHRDKAVAHIAAWLWECETGYRSGRPGPFGQ